MIKRAYESVKSSFANLVGKKAMMKNTCTSRFAAIPVALLSMIIWLVPSVLIANDNAANVSITPSPIYVWEGQTASASGTVSPTDQFGGVTFAFVMSGTGTATVTPGTATAGVTALTITGVKSGTTTLKGFVDGKEKTSVPVTVLSLVHTTVATTPQDRSRLTVGVGEEVSFDTKPNTTVTWSVTGGGTMSTVSGPSTRYTAPDAAASSTVTATLANGTALTISLTVVPPASATMTAVAPFFHRNGVPSAGFRAMPVTINPTTVSFYRIQIHEGDAVAVSTGVFLNGNGDHHGDDGPWQGVKQDNSMNGYDDVGTFGAITDPKQLQGTFTWSIPWFYRIVKTTGAGTQFTIMTHKAVSDATGTTTQSKGGAAKTFQLYDATKP